MRALLFTEPPSKDGGVNLLPTVGGFQGFRRLDATFTSPALALRHAEDCMSLTECV